MQKRSQPLYSRLLSGKRRRKTMVGGRTLEEETESDRGRILFSAPWRRLQNKAQVFSLESNAAVRTRLTHSLEVATVGRQLAQAAIIAIRQKDRGDTYGLAGQERAFINFVENACLIHDLGNPPFGHFGEDAISEWFQNNKTELRVSGIGGRIEQLWETHWSDLINFDGNPQGFRIVTRLQASETDDLHGLNLTATTLAATLKYPASEAAPNKKYKRSHFHTEDDVVKWVHDTLGMVPSARHPLVTLMEAADDIAYCMSDIEDSIEKGIITERDFIEYISASLKQFKKGSVFSPMIPELKLILARFKSRALPKRIAPLMDLRSFVARILSKYVGDKFAQKHDEIVGGSLQPLLDEDGPDALLGIFKAFARSHIYKSKVVLQREISAHSILSGLLNAYKHAMVCDYDRFLAALNGCSTDENDKRVTVERSLLSRLPKKHIETYMAFVNKAYNKYGGDEGSFKVIERIYRMRLILDCLTGMTDSYALHSFHLVSGAEI